MMTRIMNFLNENDHFAKENAMTITSLEKGHSVAVLIAAERHFNGVGIVMGGALFTLSDFSFAAAINSFGYRAVSMSSSVSFLRPGKGVPGTRFKAEAKLVSRTRRTAVFDVDTFDDTGKQLTHSVMTGFITDVPFFEEEGDREGKA